MMNMSAPFIARPVATTLLTAGILLAGLLGFMGLPVSPLPKIEFPTIQVQASLPGASPDTVSTSVPTPLERAQGAIAGITESPTSTVGNSRITLQFDLSRNIDGAARDVQAAINAAAPTCRRTCAAIPSIARSSRRRPALGAGADVGHDRPGSSLRRSLNILQQKLSQVTGVGGGAGGSSCRRCGSRSIPTSVEYRIGLEACVLHSRQRQYAQGRHRSGRWQRCRSIPTTRRAPPRVRPDHCLRNGSPVQLSDVAQIIVRSRTFTTRAGQRRALAGDHLPAAPPTSSR
jgi:multidrug efflux pump